LGLNNKYYFLGFNNRYYFCLEKARAKEERPRRRGQGPRRLSGKINELT